LTARLRRRTWDAAAPANDLVLDSELLANTFGEDEVGELYLAGDDDGVVYRLVDPRPFCDVAMSRDAYTNG
jgi:hypothetical protein